MSIKDKITDEYIRDLLVRMAHHSTAIEGNTLLTLDENISILIKYYIPKEMPEKSYNEVRNYRELFPILLNLLDKKEKEIKVEEIKDYNKIIMANLSDDAGQYKKNTWS